MAVGGLCGVIAVFCLLGLAVGLDTSIWVIRLLTFCNGFADRLVRHRRPELVVRDHLLGRHRPRIRAVPDPTQVAGGIGVAVLVTVVSVIRPAGADRRRAGPRVPPRLPDRRRDDRHRRRLIALTIRDADAAGTMRRREAVPAAAASSGDRGGHR